MNDNKEDIIYIKEYLKKLNDEITYIRNDLIVIKKTLDKTDVKCEKMTDHIEFIDGIYVKVKGPFEYIINLLSAKRISLPLNTDGIIMDTEKC